jgi:hypothetical protein
MGIVSVVFGKSHSVLVDWRGDVYITPLVFASSRFEGVRLMDLGPIYAYRRSLAEQRHQQMILQAQNILRRCWSRCGHLTT